MWNPRLVSSGLALLTVLGNPVAALADTPTTLVESGVDLVAYGYPLWFDPGTFWYTIPDCNTGLIWEKLSDDGSIHDWDNRYIWLDAFAVKIATLNAGGGFAGATDWRVPNIRELRSIVDFRK